MSTLIKAIKATLNFRSAGASRVSAVGDTACIDRLSARLAEIAASVAVLRREIDDLYGRR